MKKYKYITIRQATGTAGTHKGKPLYEIVNNRRGDILGVIFWDTTWKQYVSNLELLAVFSAECHEDIADFIKNEAGKI